MVQFVVHFKAEFKTGEDVKKKLRFLREERLSPHEVKPDGFVDHFFAKKWSTIFLFSRKILSTSNWRIFRVSKGGAFSLLEKFSGRNWNFILPQKEFEHRENGRKEIRTSGLYT